MDQTPLLSAGTAGMTTTRSASAPRTKRFRSTTSTRADPAVVARQANASTQAFAVFGDMEATRNFMNQAYDALGGRPIDVAGASAEGLEKVAQAVAKLRTLNVAATR